MASQYSHLQFFRRAPNALLVRYFKFRDAVLDVDITTLMETDVEPVLRSGPRVLDTPLSEILMHVQAAKTGAA